MLLRIFMGSIGSIGVLAVALWLLSSRDDNPYREKGLLPTLLRCIVLVVGVKVLDLMLYNGVQAIGDPSLGYVSIGILIAAWFIGIMYFFQRNLIHAIMLTAAMWALDWCTAFALDKLSL